MTAAIREVSVLAPMLFSALGPGNCEALIEALIDRLDKVAGDADDEAEEDCCAAGDDHFDLPGWCVDCGPGDPGDAEDGHDAEQG